VRLHRARGVSMNVEQLLVGAKRRGPFGRFMSPTGDRELARPGSKNDRTGHGSSAVALDHGNAANSRPPVVRTKSSRRNSLDDGDVLGPVSFLQSKASSASTVIVGRACSVRVGSCVSILEGHEGALCGRAFVGRWALLARAWAGKDADAAPVLPPPISSGRVRFADVRSSPRTRKTQNQNGPIV